nr:MAG TPA: hypothetical protein [Caudoviricetes sp.]
MNQIVSNCQKHWKNILNYTRKRGHKMLIRSQDKRMIVNFDNICTVSAFPEKDSEDIYVEDGTGSLMVGRYSAKEKAMKVLDMIQEAYVNGHIDYQIPADSEVVV